MEIPYVTLLILFILLSAFFSSSETAYISLSHVRLNHLLANKVPGAKRVAKMVEHPERLLSAILVGNNLVNTAATAIATVLAISFWGEEHGVVIATIGITVILLIFGEVTPKSFAARYSEKVAIAYAGPVRFITILFSPVVYLLSSLVLGLMKLMGGGSVYRRSLFNEDEIRSLIDRGHIEGSVEKDQAEMLHRVFEFADRDAADVMIPRSDVVLVEKGTDLMEFLKIYTERPMTRFPVYEENVDQIVGIISVKDVLISLASNEVQANDPIDTFIRPASFAPASKMVDDLFQEMREKRLNMCIIIDEYGAMAGIVSMTDLVEEIVGPVRDEYSRNESDFRSVNDHTFQVSGSMRIDDANRQMELGIPESEEYQTVAGFILKILGKIPAQGKTFRYKNLRLFVTSMRGLKIAEVLIIRDKNETPADQISKQDAI